MLVSYMGPYVLRVAGVLGVGQVPLAQDLDDIYLALDLLIAQWQRKRWLIYRLDELSCPVVPGQATYSVGPGGDLDVPYRPADIESAYVRQSFNVGNLPVDHPLGRINTREEWGRIALKNLISWPGSFFYDPQLTTGTFYIWPIPQQTFFTLFVNVQQDINPVDFVGTPDIEITTFVPPEAEEALVWNLAARARTMWQLPPNPDINAMARSTLDTLRSVNFRVQQLSMPAAVLSRRRGQSYVRNPNAGFIETNIGVPITVTVP